MTIHALAGLPRSGSTLLANILAQHPDVYASGTSVLANVVDAAQTVLSNDPTVVSELNANPGMYQRYQSALRGLIGGLYAGIEEPCIIDKGRGWAGLWGLAQDIDPESRLIVTVRDPRDVIASIEKQNIKSGIFKSPVAPTLRDAAEQLMTVQGLVGAPIKMAEDLLRRRSPNVLFVRFESFVVDPKPVMDKISEHLSLEPFKWDFENVENRGGDNDAVWRGKYPHDGSGSVHPPQESWQDFLDPELAGLIAGVFPFYMSTFSY